MKSNSKKWLSGLTAALVVGVTLGGCGLLDVENPNNLVEDDLSNPVAAGAMANGLEAAVTDAIGEVMSVYATATDELKWTGSRDGYQQLDFGIIDDRFNEFIDGTFQQMGSSRWVADNYVERLEAFREAGTLSQASYLIRAYLYKAIIYTTVADMYDDYAISDRTEPGPAIGPANMFTLYDEALSALNKGIDLGASGELLTQLTAMRARVKYSRLLWEKVNPVDTANPLVSAPDAAADAQAALEMMGSPSWVYELVTDGGIGFTNSTGSWVNDRTEMVIGPTYARPNETGKRVEEVIFADLIDGTVHPYLATFIPAWVEAGNYPDMPIVSAREMHLIIAENALAGGDTDGFTTAINNLRAVDGLSPYTGQVDAVELLVDSRQANLFMQGRRLADHYRFADPSPEWTEAGDAVTKPGTFLPIPNIEIESNPLIN